MSEETTEYQVKNTSDTEKKGIASILNEHSNTLDSMISELESIGEQENRKVEDARKNVLDRLKSSQNAIKDASKTWLRSSVKDETSKIDNKESAYKL